MAAARERRWEGTPVVQTECSRASRSDDARGLDLRVDGADRWARSSDDRTNAAGAAPPFSWLLPDASPWSPGQARSPNRRSVMLALPVGASRRRRSLSRSPWA